MKTQSKKQSKTHSNKMTLVTAFILMTGLTTYAQEKLTLTPPQTEGPFYPGRDLVVTKGSDLTNQGSAHGELIEISGEVVDENNRPLSEAKVHLWQTDGFKGRYINDESLLPIDENFNYFGTSSVDFLGKFRFISVRPKEYKADEDWTRPEHLHFKIFIKNKEVLTTQTYFEGDPLIGEDKILNRLTPEQRASVIVKYEPGEIDLGMIPQCKKWFFDQEMCKITKPGIKGKIKFVVNSALLN